QIVDLVELTPRHVETFDVRTGGDQRLAELDLGLAREGGDSSRQVESGDARAREQLDALLLPPAVRAKQGLLSSLFAAQISLRAVRAVVRRIGLAPDQKHLALGVLLPQPARAVGRGQAAADQKIIDLTGSHRILNLRETEVRGASVQRPGGWR